MLQFLGFATGATLFAILFARRPSRVVSAYIALWVLVPAVGASALTGIPVGSTVSGVPGLHPGTLLAFSSILVQWTRPSFRSSLASRRYANVALATVIVAMLVINALASTGGFTQLADQVIAPVIVFLHLQSVDVGTSHVRALSRVILLLASFEAVIAHGIRMGVFAQPYLDGFATQYWFSNEYARALGTTDHPLALSVLLVGGMALAWVHLRPLVAFPVSVLMFSALLLTESRTGIFVATALLVIVITRLRVSTLTRFTLAVGAILMAYVGSKMAIAVGVISRLSDDGGSAEARGLAAKWFLSNWYQYGLWGDGTSQSYVVAATEGLGTSLESAFLMYSVDYGILIAVIYFILPIWLVRRAPGTSKLPVVTVLVLVMSYSSVATESLVGPLLWVLTGLVMRQNTSGLKTDFDTLDDPMDARGARALEHNKPSSFAVPRG